MDVRSLSECAQVESSENVSVSSPTLPVSECIESSKAPAAAPPAGARECVREKVKTKRFQADNRKRDKKPSSSAISVGRSAPISPANQLLQSRRFTRRNYKIKIHTSAAVRPPFMHIHPKYIC